MLEKNLNDYFLSEIVDTVDEVASWTYGPRSMRSRSFALARNDQLWAEVDDSERGTWRGYE